MSARQLSTRDEYPLRLIIDGEDCTFEVGEGFTFANSHPGGYEAASFPIPHDKPTIKRGQTARLESGLSVAWEGRIKEVQRSLGAKTLIQCEGFRVLLAEASEAEIFVDRELSRWGSPSVSRELARVRAGYTPGGPELTDDPATLKPAIGLTCSGPWESTTRPAIEAWYNSGGIRIGGMTYLWAGPGALGKVAPSESGCWINPTDEHWFWGATLAKTSTAEGLQENPSFRGYGPSLLGEFVSAPADEAFFALLQLVYSAAGGTSGAEYTLLWEDLAIFGYRMQQLYVSEGESNTVINGPYEEVGAVGVWGSDVVKLAVSLLDTVQLGFIGTTGTPAQRKTAIEGQPVIPHLVYRTPVPLEKWIDDAAKYNGWHWGVWAPREYLTTTNTLPRVDFTEVPEQGNPTAWAWRNQCEGLDIREAIDNQYDTAVVSYNEPSGEENFVTATYANPLLEARGIHRELNLSFGTGTEATAKAYGELQLAVLATQGNVTGSCTIVEPIQKMQGGRFPAYMLHAGQDRLRIPDLPTEDDTAFGADTDLLVTRVECSGTAEGLQTSLEFGIGVNLIETLTARLEANVRAAS